MDEVIFEEFKGNGNAEIVLDRKLADKEPFKQLILQSLEQEKRAFGRKESYLKWVLRKFVPMGTTDAMNFL